MFRFVMIFAVSVWMTSTLFMLWNWLNAFIYTYATQHKLMLMPLGAFLYLHFCPIVHTINCVKIMKKTAELQRRM